MIHKAGNPEKLMYIQSISTSEFIHSSCGILSRGDQVVQFSSSSQPLKKGKSDRILEWKGNINWKWQPDRKTHHQHLVSAKCETSDANVCSISNQLSSFPMDFPVPWVAWKNCRLPNFQTAKVLEGQHRTLSGLNCILRCQHKWWALVAV